MDGLNYHKLYISQLLKATAPKDPLDEASPFLYESLKFKGVWIQGHVQLIDDEDNVDDNDNDDIDKEVGDDGPEGLVRFLINDGTGDIMVVKNPSILSIDLTNGQYILVAGLLVSFVDGDGQEDRFIIVQKMADQNKNAKQRERIWHLEIAHIQSRVYHITVPTESPDIKQEITTKQEVEMDTDKVNYNDYDFTIDDNKDNYNNKIVIDDNDDDTSLIKSSDLKDIEFDGMEFESQSTIRKTTTSTSTASMITTTMTTKIKDEMVSSVASATGKNSRDSSQQEIVDIDDEW
ncbi:hypothetical protein SAMD00019534_103260 [Acytostelium subglobosum LB1]|uniref:hypothetical protein n=1 Tax=Acytostelium subglobosum LB1 TaxID=1410327 RepID=UPI000644AF50|nr:hypothetical protein SAMD00019534_103260 [Acytostelium subglobosum LB1]GAM27151.1 hypothetical protein SAMD00019534_103260 [Acytostelium subglobosum LB1]|eukprot:XP_012750031.1 hypothetical protein SAMD00019534_103260 [Acytostelium subglobosum LB1]